MFITPVHGLVNITCIVIETPFFLTFYSMRSAILTFAFEFEQDSFHLVFSLQLIFFMGGV